MAGDLAEASHDELVSRLAFLEEVLGDDVRNRLEERERAARAAAERRRLEEELRIREEERRRAEVAEAEADRLRCARRDELMVEARSLFDRMTTIYDELVVLANESSSAKYVALDVRCDDADRALVLLLLVREGRLPWGPRRLMYMNDEGGPHG